ncbi:tRNA intron endonuclease, catalytic domain-like [Cinara cedri]|uniref:tRNA-intron lyase n=1 Tax=Cinara cedri TaxID=506608 RepID=A0A5E4NN89_9HEMI|nr:tRNA intron endonuclease, catalytic domain-like [Cinara cedri]
MSNNNENLITIYMVDNKGFIWNANDWYSLRTTHRIMGSLVGTIPSENDGDEEEEEGLPSYLLPEEVRLLIEKGICCAVKHPTNYNFEPSMKNETIRSIIENQTIDETKENVGNSKVNFTCIKELNSKIIDPLPELKEAERLKYKVFKDLWSKGFYLTCGIKFGGDFLVYEGDPTIHHASYIVNCIDSDEKMFVSQSRVSSITNKKMVLAKEDGDSIKYLIYELGITSFENP